MKWIQTVFAMAFYQTLYNVIALCDDRGIGSRVRIELVSSLKSVSNKCEGGQVS